MVLASVMVLATALVMDIMDLVMDIMDLAMDTVTTPGHRPNGMEMLLLTLQMMNTPTQLLSM